jgi:exopolysaccharide biosynthesis protein
MSHRVHGSHRGRSEDQRQPPRKHRLAKVVIWGVAAVVYAYVSTSIFIFHGPWKAITSFTVDSLATTRHAYLLRPLSLYTISSRQISVHSVGWTKSNGVASTKLSQNFSLITDPTITKKTVVEPTFTANLLFIRNPRRVEIAVTKYRNVRGETVAEMVQDTGAVAGINGGAFNDAGWRGTGGVPVGTTIHNGKILNYDPSAGIIGMTAEGQLVCGSYSKQELLNMNVTEAVTFGPILVQDGNPVAPVDYSRQPRTAIGQEPDGTIILLVTDGRGATGLNDLGATYIDVQNLMKQFGAQTAANLDGGSSATMVYQNKLQNIPADVLGARLVATAIVVKP